MPRKGSKQKLPSGRFPPKNSKRKKSKGKSNNRRNLAEPEELTQNLFVKGSAKPNMKTFAKRPNRHFLSEEVQYTGDHADVTMKQPLRKRPIVFVKAKEVYDPNDVLRKIKKDLTEEMSSLRVELNDANEVSEVNQVNEVDMADDVSKSEMEDIDVQSEEGPQREIPVAESEASDSESDEKIEEPEQEMDVESNQEIEEDLANPDKDNDSSEPEPEHVKLKPDFIIDESGDQTIAEVSKPASLSDALAARFKPGANLEHNPVISIGNISLNTSQKNGETYAEIDADNGDALDYYESEEASDEESDSDNDIAGYKNYIANVFNNIDQSDVENYESDTNFDIMAESTESELEEEESPETPDVAEYGFLPEDYEFDVSQLSISNVRFGIQNQYFVKSYELTGAVDDLTWVDEDELFDFVLMKGVKEHRLDSFMKFMTKGLVDEEEFKQPDYSDVYISETSEESEEERNMEDDGLEQIIEFTKNQAKMDLDLPPTSSLSTSGKGRKKRLELEHLDLELEIRESLQEQYLNQRQSKRARKERKEDAIRMEGYEKNDLRTKYAYSMHIKDFRDEFERFLHDSSRQNMSFPPLDPHGNKTVCKMASCYNMKTTKNGGNGLKQFIKVSKNRKTFHYLPRYDQVASILRQRPIFNRTDVKRPKDEIARTDGNTKKDRQRQRNKSQDNAQVREGDIVGRLAPEIDKSNIGRQLLEKLGWVKGEGLGAHGNKGISEPVAATVKKSKTGLK